MAGVRESQKCWCLHVKRKWEDGAGFQGGEAGPGAKAEREAGLLHMGGCGLRGSKLGRGDDPMAVIQVVCMDGPGVRWEELCWWLAAQIRTPHLHECCARRLCEQLAMALASCR